MAYKEKIYEGKYFYFKDGRQYSEENFEVQREAKANGEVYFNAEILSRVSTGEFLKIHTELVMTHNFDTLRASIKRSLGKNKSTEKFNYESKSKNVYYSFNSKAGFHEFEKQVNGKFGIALPSFSTSLAMTLGKKVDMTQRTPYTVLTSKNIWDYQGGFEEKQIYLEVMNPDPVNIELGGNELTAMLYHMFEYDKAMGSDEKGTPFYVSRHLNIPYQIDFGNGKIEIDKLKVLESKYKGMF